MSTWIDPPIYVFHLVILTSSVSDAFYRKNVWHMKFFWQQNHFLWKKDEMKKLYLLPSSSFPGWYYTTRLAGQVGVKPVWDHVVPGGAGGEASIRVSWKWNGKSTGNILRCMVAEFAFHGSFYVKNETTIHKNSHSLCFAISSMVCCAVAKSPLIPAV